MKIEVVSASTALPLDLEDVKRHLRIEVGETEQDDHLSELVTGAADMVEGITNRALTRRRLRVYFDEWPGDGNFKLPYPPFSTDVAPVVAYKDADSSSVTVSSTVYKCDAVSEPGRICVDYNEDWPTCILHNVNPISITYTCGYSASTAIPKRLKLAMKILIADYNENRESIVVGNAMVQEIPKHVANLLRDYRNFSF